MNIVWLEGPVELLKLAVNKYNNDEYCFHSIMQFILVLLIKLYSSNCLADGGSAAALMLGNTLVCAVYLFVALCVVTTFQRL